MFSTGSIYKDGLEITNLIDQVSGTSAEIISTCGGILHSFNIFHQNGLVNVIDQYSSKDDVEQHLTSKGFKSCKLSPFACRIKNGNYSFDKKTYHLQKFMLNGNAIHGLIYDAHFSIVHQFAGEENATLVIQYEYEGVDPGYPFHFDCIITYQLIKNNELLISTEIINRDKESIPLQDGWHPYFTLGKKIDDLELMVKTKKQVVFDKEIIPTGEFKDYNEFVEGKKLGGIQLDDCFLLDQAAEQPACILKDAANSIQIEIEPDSSYPYLQLYTPPHRNSIAIENLSAPPDTFNNGIDLIILGPSESKTFTTSFTIKSIK